MTPQQPRPARALLILCAIGFTGFFAAYLRIPVLPLLAVALGGSPGQVGIINAAFMLSAGLLSIPAGVLADRVGRRPTLLGGICILSLSSFLIAAATSPLQMAAIYLFFGAGLAAFAPTMMSLVADTSPPSHLGRTFAWYTTAVYTAMTFGPAVGGFLAKAAGLKPVFLISGGVLFLLGAAVFMVIPRESSCHLAPQARHLLTAIGRVLGNRQFLASLLATLGGCFAFGVFVTFLPLYALSHGLDPGRIGLVFSAQAVVNVISRIPFGRLGDNATNRGPLAAAGFILIGVAVAAIGLCATAVSLAACGALLGTGMAIGFTAVTAIIVAAVPRAERGLAMGLYNSCIFLGMMVGSAVMGGVIHEAGYRAGFIGGGGVCAVLTFVFVALYRRGEGCGVIGG